MRRHITITFFFVIIFVVGFCYYNFSRQQSSRPSEYREYESHDQSYFTKKYGDPRTNTLNVVTAQQRLKLIERIKPNAAARTKDDLFDWFEAGPSDKAGRTRAIDIDERNTQIVITGGVRGGIWKSMDGGATWYQPDGLVKSESITSIVQHPGLPDTWIASTGEFVGSNGATFLGGALYRSDDNGETWNPILYQNTFNENTNTYEYQMTTLGDVTSAPTSPNCGEFCDGVPFMYTNNLVISPTTGVIYVATNGWGILQSKDTLKTFIHLLPSIPNAGTPAELANDQETSLLLRFDNDAKGENGEITKNVPTLQYIDGVHGQAALLSDGQELIFDAADNIDSRTGTVEFWIKPQWSGDDGGENDFLLYGEIPGAIFMHRVFGYVEVIANLAGADPNFQVGATAQNTHWLPDEWHHLAFTWSSDKVQTYVDGTLVSASDIQYNLPMLTAADFKIGNSDVPINAYLDEFRISNMVRTADDILESYRSGGIAQSKALPDARPAFSNIQVHPNGHLLGYVENLGYFHSIDQGTNWVDIDPGHDNLPITSRSVLAMAPSNPDVAYILSLGALNNLDKLRFFRVNLKDYSFEDRSSNIESGDDQTFADAWTLVIQVKPNDENFVLVGGQQLFRSTHGFSSALGAREDFFIVGHGQVIPHVDNHIIVFEPGDPNTVWLGNDGGVWRTEDITQVSSMLPNVQWQNKNLGYHVTQFYTVAIHPEAGAPQLMGGTQDRGTPTLNQHAFEIAPYETDAFGGDGGWCWYGRQFAYVSAQGGELRRVAYNGAGQPDIERFGSTLLAKLTTEAASERFFIHPFVLDPNNENILYYPQANKVYRLLDNLSMMHDNLDVKEDWDQHPVMQADTNMMISAISVSNSPPDILYYGTLGETQKIYRVADAHSANPIQTEATIPGVVPWSFINNVAINPVDADEIVVVISSFNVPGLFHSTDGGQSYVNVEGNLADDLQLPGPSLVWLDILVHNNKKYYLLGTRIGLFVTEELDGTNTLWQHQAEDLIGYNLVDMVVSRTSDGKVAVGTHGRGIFTGFPIDADIMRMSNLKVDGSITAVSPGGSSDFKEGEELILSFKVANDGDLESSPFEVGLKVGDTIDAQLEVSMNLPANQSTEISEWSTGYIITSDMELTVILDPNNKISESDETDNEKTFSVTLAETTPIINTVQNHDLEVYPNPALVNEEIFIKSPFLIDQVRLVDLHGKEYQITPKISGEGLTFRIAGIQKGLYFLQVKGESRRSVRPLLML